MAFVTDNLRIGGTELNAVRTAERLDRGVFDLRVVCLSEGGPLAERYAAIGVPVESMPISSFYGRDMVRSGVRFMRMLRREQVDIVHAHDVYSNIFAAAWARPTAGRSLITSRRWWTSLPNRGLQLGSRFAASVSSAVLANSAAVARLVASEVPAAAQRVKVITNFVDDAAFGAPDPDARARNRAAWGAPADAVVLGCVARFDPVKDHAGLLRAFALVRAQDARARLVLIGDGPTRPMLEAVVDELGVRAAVHFAGEIRGKTNLHRGFDISVLSSTSEGFPNSIVEAMAAGNPVVATAVGGTVDAVVDGETGLLVPPAHPAELANALLRLLESSEMRAAFGRAGERRARERFHASSVIAALSRMYEELAFATDR